jgi:SAM-dependent methyltransferase
VLEVLLPVLDIVHQPAEDPQPPAWCRQRGWDGFLLGLGCAELELCEAHGLGALPDRTPGLPPDLARLVVDVQAVTRLPRLAPPALDLPAAALRGVSARKRQQLTLLLGAVARMATSAGRIVDVGAGSGHLARLAAELFARPTLALDRDAERIARGRLLVAKRAREVAGLSVEFALADACATPPTFRPSDLAIGLHACGELGDHLVTSAAVGCDLALISCCPQKIRAPSRSAISRAGAGLLLRREALGLCNLSARPEGVETSSKSNVLARETRYALRQLLISRGLSLGAGAEMRNINRRRAHAGLAELAAHACRLRSLTPPTATEVELHERNAQRDHARVRRLSLPRHLLARLVELAVIFDRGAALEAAGQAVRVAALFDPSITPRNVAIFASRDAGRLPRLAP